METIQNQELLANEEVDTATSSCAPDCSGWENYADCTIMQQQSEILAMEAAKVPFIGDKEPLTSLEAEYQSGSPILLEKIKSLGEKYAAIRRTREMETEHVLNSQDRTEVDRIKVNIENSRKALLSLGYAEFTFEDFFALFLEQLGSVLQGCESPISHDELVLRSRDHLVSDYIVMFFRFITSAEIRKRSEFFEPFIMGLSNTTVEQFCKSSVDPMGEESDHVHVTALSDALGVPIRIVYLDRSSIDASAASVNHHDFIPTTGNTSAASSSSKINSPFVTLLYRPGHYDILYPKGCDNILI